MKNTYIFQNVVHSGTLDAASIDEMSAVIVRTLEELKVDAKEITRMRLSAESVMAIWAEELGEAAPCRLIKKTPRRPFPAVCSPARWFCSRSSIFRSCVLRSAPRC